MTSPVAIVILCLSLVISAFNSYLLYSILHIIKDNYASQSKEILHRYQQAVNTPSPKEVPGRPVKQDANGNIDLADIDFETGYDALAAYGKGEN